MSKPSGKIIMTCAVTGGIHTPTVSDASPYTPDDIASQAIAAAEAGAAILHRHARDPRNGSPSPQVSKSGGLLKRWAWGSQRLRRRARCWR